MRRRLGLETLVVVDDFTALAMALPRLAPSQRRQVGGGEAREASVLGAGTGLDVSGLVALLVDHVEDVATRGRPPPDSTKTGPNRRRLPRAVQDWASAPPGRSRA